VETNIVITIPNNNLPERKYAVDIVFGELLRQKYSLVVANVENYKIVVNNRKLIVKDYFFNLFKSPLSYLKKENLPRRCRFLKCRFTEKDGLPVFFGTEEFTENKDEIICGSDLFASVFFMLTRWEEYVSEKKDSHGRMPTFEHFAVCNELGQRPIVNEIAEFIWSVLKSMGLPTDRVPDYSELVITHDVDRVYRQKLKESAITCFRLRQPKRFLIDIYYRAANIDVIGTFRKIMDASEEIGQRSRFYLLVGGNTSTEGYYSLKDEGVIKLINEIKQRGHVIGFHPSYNTYNNQEIWANEKRELKRVVQAPIVEGRQHYLRFENPTTWQIWDQNQMEVDSTMGFADYVGFRCGTANEFSLFHILNRKKLQIKERPLLLMDSAIMKLNRDSRSSSVDRLKEACKRYNMPFTILFHNHILDNTLWNNQHELYKNLLGFESH